MKKILATTQKPAARLIISILFIISIAIGKWYFNNNNINTGSYPQLKPIAVFMWNAQLVLQYILLVLMAIIIILSFSMRFFYQRNPGFWQKVPAYIQKTIPYLMVIATIWGIVFLPNIAIHSSWQAFIENALFILALLVLQILLPWYLRKKFIVKR
jgi:hypothetical protein